MLVKELFVLDKVSDPHCFRTHYESCEGDTVGGGQYFPFVLKDICKFCISWAFKYKSSAQTLIYSILRSQLTPWTAQNLFFLNNILFWSQFAREKCTAFIIKGTDYLLQYTYRKAKILSLGQDHIESSSDSIWAKK